MFLNCTCTYVFNEHMMDDVQYYAFVWWVRRLFTNYQCRSRSRPYHFAIWLSFSNICHVTSRKLRLPQCIMADDLHIWSYLVQNERGAGERNTCSFRSPWVTLPLNLFFPTHSVLFPSALIWAVDGTVCPAEYALYHLPCDLYVVVYVCK